MNKDVEAVLQAARSGVKHIAASSDPTFMPVLFIVTKTGGTEMVGLVGGGNPRDHAPQVQKEVKARKGVAVVFIAECVAMDDEGAKDVLLVYARDSRDGVRHIETYDIIGTPGKDRRLVLSSTPVMGHIYTWLDEALASV